MSQCHYRLCPGGSHQRNKRWPLARVDKFHVTLRRDCETTHNGARDEALRFDESYSWCYFMAWGEYWIADVAGCKPNYKAAALNFTHAVEAAQDEQQRVVARQWLLLATLEGVSI